MEKLLDYQRITWRFPNFKPKALTLSYDDGREFDRKMVEILDRHQIRCTFNLTSNFLFDDKHVTKEEIPELYKNHEVAIHSLTHPQLGYLNSAEVSYQLINDRLQLEQIMKKPVDGMAYPNGLQEFPGMIDAVKACGIRYARATTGTYDFKLPTDPLRWYPTCHQTSPRLNEMIDNFLAPFPHPQSWRIHPKLLFIWGHSYVYEFDWTRLETMCERLAGHEDVWYATNMEIIDYIDALRSLRTTVDGHYIYNPTHITLYVNANNTDVILQPGCLTEIPAR